jgi:hypothetical protein
MKLLGEMQARAPEAFHQLSRKMYNGIGDLYSRMTTK